MSGSAVGCLGETGSGDLSNEVADSGIRARFWIIEVNLRGVASLDCDVEVVVRGEFGEIGNGLIGGVEIIDLGASLRQG